MFALVLVHLFDTVLHVWMWMQDYCYNRWSVILSKNDYDYQLPLRDIIQCMTDNVFIHFYAYVAQYSEE